MVMGLFSSQAACPFCLSFNSRGVGITLRNPSDVRKIKTGKATPELIEGYIRMQALAESGEAETKNIADGIFIVADDAVRLDSETREIFNLPPTWPGGLRLESESIPRAPAFDATLYLIFDLTQKEAEWSLDGAVLNVRGREYLPSAAQYCALTAFVKWRSMSVRGVADNYLLLVNLESAKKMGANIEMGFGSVDFHTPSEVAIDLEESDEGGLLLPIPQGDFTAIRNAQIRERLHQLDSKLSTQIMEVGSTIIVLDEKQTEMVRRIRRYGVLTPEQVKAFKQSPSVWMADNIFPDIEMEFSPRVLGIGEWVNSPGITMTGEKQDWFDKRPETEGPKSDKTKESASPPDKVEPEEDSTSGVMVTIIAANESTLEYGWRDVVFDEASPTINASNLKRKPLPHQVVAIEWLLKHGERAFTRIDREGFDGPDLQPGNGAGALLADDMGLGKTFSSLVGVENWLQEWRRRYQSTAPAVLVVAPLSLLQNWKNEVQVTFEEPSKVFSRVLVAHPDYDLHLVKRTPLSRDRAIPGEVTEFGLGFGDASERSVDMPGSLVLTTYSTLRDYRFSFAKAEWAVVLFDEAQQIKNPTAISTIAAKSLKGKLRVSLTGTPIENHLGEFWCIIDTCEPGPLGSLVEFKEKWVKPIQREPGCLAEHGKALQKATGALMLRRLKEDELEGLPRKTVTYIECPLEPEQESLYFNVRKRYHETCDGVDQGGVRKNFALQVLWTLREASLHPGLVNKGQLPLARSGHEAKAVLSQSAKTKWLLIVLEEIKSKDEKVLIFCIQKRFQEGLARLLGQIYGVSIPVINGDTKATSKLDPESTRMGLIETFSETPGFGICILSPIAAGAGLNITAANHVIHLERHWNSAKEDQATDRVYRIGQTKDVHVYIPIANHPKTKTFDVILASLIKQKRGLQGAMGLIPPEPIQGRELLDEVFEEADVQTDELPLTLDKALQLSWSLFEALLAEIYKVDSDEVILAAGNNDHGCDVIVLGYGPHKKNLIVQAKTTKHRNFDSEVAIREVYSSKPIIERLLERPIDELVLHSTAVTFSARLRDAAKTCNVQVYGRDWLSRILKGNQFYTSRLVLRDSMRTRI
jgi:hypothetical protein